MPSNNWKYYTLKELVEIKYGRNQKDVASKLGDYPIFGTGGLMGYATKYLYDKPSVLIGRKGTINKVKYVKQPFWTVDTLFYTVINTEIVNSKFLYYLMSLLDLDNYNEGTTIPSLRTETLYRLEFKIPPLETQQKIVKILNAIDDKIELNNSINNNLEQQAQAIFKSWFVDFEPFGNTMPFEWNIGKLEEIVEFSNGYAFKSSELLSCPDVDCYNVFKQGHINRGGGFNPLGTKSWYPKDKAKNLGKYILKKGDILMAMTDMKDNVAILGNTALMGVDDQYIVNQRVGLLRAKNDYNISYPFIYILTNSTDFLTDLRKRANSGVQVNLSSTEIKNSDVVIATKDINSKFDNIVKPFFEQIFINNLENSHLIQLRDTLLPKLMSGEIDVSKVDISADKLLFSEEKYVNE